MNPVAIYTGTLTIYWAGILVTLGLAAALALTLALHPMDAGRNAAVWVFFPFAFVFSVAISRAIHWYCHMEMYSSFVSAMTDYSSGSFVLVGVIFGVLLAALLVRGLQLTKHTGQLLDAAAPGLALLTAFVRLSAYFTDACRGKVAITDPRFQRLPFASAMTDAAGNVSYRLASWCIEAILMLVLTVLLVVFYCRHRRDPMKAGGSRYGNVFRMFLLLFSIVEFPIDSTRYDSAMFHFSGFLRMLNKYISFVSLPQLFCAISILCILIHYMKISVRANGWRWYHIVLLVIYVGTLVGVGYFAEYRVQRYAAYLQCYSIMVASLLVMALVVYLLYLSGKKKRIYTE